MSTRVPVRQAASLSCVADGTLWTLQGVRLVGLDVDSGCELRSVALESGAPRCICAVQFPLSGIDASSDLQQLWVGFPDGSIAVVHASTLRVVSQQLLHEGAVEGLCVVGVHSSPTVVSVAADGRAALWQPATQECIGCVKVSHAALTCVCEVPSISPSMVVGTSSGNVHVLSLASQSETLLIPGAHAGEVTACHVVEPHKSMSCTTKSIRLWTLGGDGAFCLWGIQETPRGTIVLASKTPLVHHTNVLGGTSDVVCVDFTISRTTVFCVLAAAAGFAVLDCWTGDIVRTWSATKSMVPLGATLRLLPRCIRRAWSIAPDGQCGTCEVPFYEASMEQTPQRSNGSRPISPPPPMHPPSAEYQADVTRLRNENQKLRDQIQSLLRSPLQRTLHDNATRHDGASPHNAMNGEASLLQLKNCYSSALGVLDSMEHYTREFVVGLEDETRHQASSWVQLTQRATDAKDIRRRYQELLVDYHKAQESVDELSQALTTSRLEASAAQQRHDASAMKAAAAEKQLTQLRDILAHTEARLTDREVELRSLAGRGPSPPQPAGNDEEQEKLRALLMESERKHTEAVDALQRQASQHALEHEDLVAKLASQVEAVESYRAHAKRSGEAEEATLRRVEDIEAQLEARAKQAVLERDEAVEAMRSTSAECALKVEHLQRLVTTLKEEASLHSEEFKARAEKLSRQQRASSETNAVLVDALQGELSEARTLNSTLKNERDQLQDERNTLAHELNMERLTMKEELHRMDVQMLTLQRHVEDGALVAEHAIAQARIGDLVRAAEDLRAEIDALKATHRTQREGLENKIIEMASQLSSCSEREAELRASLALQERLAVSKEKESRSMDASLHEDIEQLRTQSQTQKKQVEVAKRSLLEAEEANEALVVEHRREISALKQKQSIRELELDDQMHRLKAEHQSQLHSRDDRLRDMESTLLARDAAIAKWTSTCDDLQKRLTSATLQDHSDVEKALQDVVSQRDNALERLRNKTAEWLQLQADYEERHIKLSNAMRMEKTMHEESMGAMEGQLRRAQREAKQRAVNEVQILKDVETSKSEAAAQHQRELRMWEDRVKKLETRVEQLSEAEANIRRTHDGCATTKQRIELAIEERMEAQRQSNVAELKRLNDIAETAKCEAQEAKQELERTLKLCRKISNDNALLETETDDLRVQLEASSDRLRSAQRDADQLRQQAQSHQAEMQELEALRHERSANSERMRQLGATCQRLEADLDARTHSETDLNHHIRSLEEQAAALRASLEVERETVHQRDCELQRCKKSYEVLAANAAQQQKQLDELQQQHRIVVANLHAYELAQRDTYRGTPPSHRVPPVHQRPQPTPGPTTTPDARAVDRTISSGYRSPPHRFVTQWLAAAHQHTGTHHAQPAPSRSGSAAPSANGAYQKLWTGRAGDGHSQPTDLHGIGQHLTAPRH